MRSNAELATALRQLADEIAGSPAQSHPTQFPPVFNLQAGGYTQLGAVEEFRAELLKKNDPLATRFGNSLPRWWFVQDAEDYVQMTPEQQAAQDFNCSNARFTRALIGGQTSSESDNPLWRTWVNAVERVWDDSIGNYKDVFIYHGETRADGLPGGEPIYAVPSDAVAGPPTARYTTAKNPRVADMGGVVSRAYEYFRARNIKATLPIEAAYRG